MTGKSNFTPDEWKVLLQSVMAAGIAITAAEPSGLWGLLKESFAGGTELAKAKTDPGTNALIKAVVDDFSTAEGSAARDALKAKFKDSKPAQIKNKCIEVLRETAAIVDAKAPSDSAAYKRWLQQISQHVAEAANEGGFLGAGGVPISEAEKATLTEISTALKAARNLSRDVTVPSRPVRCAQKRTGPPPWAQPEKGEPLLLSVRAAPQP
jgi:hypothetical protein